MTLYLDSPYTHEEVQYLMVEAKRRLSPPQLDEMTAYLFQPSTITPLAREGWEGVATGWLEVAYDDGYIS